MSLSAPGPLDPAAQIDEAELEAWFVSILQADAVATAALRAARAAAAGVGLVQYRVVAGVLYGAVWNALTGRAAGYGLNDIDIAYFDAADLSYAAEDAAIAAAAPYFSGLPAPAQLRNQARVHLWYPRRFGGAYPPLGSVEEGVRRYATRAHAVAARLEPDDRLDVYAPFGLRDVFQMRLTPNHALENRETHTRKSARIRALWPEIQATPW